MSADLVPFPADPSELDAYADPGEFVVLACERAKSWLAQALECGDIEAIVETKSQAEAIRVYTAQKQMGHDAELSAAEVVRRAEHCISLAIRRGQESGEIRRRGQSRVPNLKSPTDFASHGELNGDGDRNPGIYALVDGVTEEQFDAAIEEAKAEGNLSRANVVRKVKGEEPRSPRDNELLRNTRRVDPNRVVEGVVSSVVVPASTFDMLDGRWKELDPDRLRGWIGSLTVERSRLTRLINCLREVSESG